MLNDLLVSQGESPLEGTEEVAGFRAKDNGKLVLVKEPFGDPEILAAYGESLYVNLPIDNDRFNRMFATYLHYLHVMGRSSTQWRRFKVAQSKHLIDRFSGK